MEAILVKPTCSNCGFQIESDCVIGAGCPKCERRLLPKPVVAAGPGDADFRALRAELDRLAAENVQLRAEKAAKKKAAPEGGSHGGA